VAVGHSLLVIVYHVLERQVNYKELGGGYFDKQNLEAQRKRLISRLKATGLKLTLEEIQNAA
jgi:hypothetical protein